MACMNSVVLVAYFHRSPNASVAFQAAKQLYIFEYLVSEYFSHCALNFVALGSLLMCLDSVVIFIRFFF